MKGNMWNLGCLKKWLKGEYFFSGGTDDRLPESVGWHQLPESLPQLPSEHRHLCPKCSTPTEPQQASGGNTEETSWGEAKEATEEGRLHELPRWSGQEEEA